jgi:hypothetical protein
MAAIAEWMLTILEAGERLPHSRVAKNVRKNYGEDLARQIAGAWTVDDRIGTVFCERGGDRVVWSRRGQLWRLRGPNDRPGLLQP